MTHVASDTHLTRQFFGHLFDVWAQCDAPVSIDTVLTSAGIRRERIEQGEPGLLLRDYYRVLTLAAPLVVNTGLFLKLGQAYNLFDLGILGYALYSAQNLSQSWDISLGYSSGLVPHPIITRRHIAADFCGIVLQPPEADSKTRRALCEEWLSGTWRWMCQRLPALAHCERAELHLGYPAPGYQHLYQELFPGEVRFNKTETALLVPREFYEQPFASSNDAIMRLCHKRSLIRSMNLEADNNLASEIRFHLLQNSHVPFPTIEKVARAFRIPVHTLHRRLARQDTTFRRLKLEVRMLLAKQYLLETTLSLQVIAHLLGYEQTTSFVRAYRRWYNITPSKARAS